MSSTTIYYVYFYLRSKDSQNGKSGTPFYIGKGSNRRAWVQHYNVPTPKNKNNIIIVENNLTELQAFMWERYYIRWFGRLNNGTGVLRNMTDGGEGVNTNPTGENNPRSISFWAIDPNGTKYIESGINQFAKLHDLTASNVVEVLKGRQTHHKNWKFGYMENSDQLKTSKRKQDKNIKGDSRFDHSIYKFFNTETQEIFKGTRSDFVHKYNLSYSGVCDLVKNRCKTHRTWCLLINRISNEENKHRRDHSIYKFFNTETQEMFEGCRINFIRKYNLNGGSVSRLIHQDRKTHKNWILLEKISE